MDSCPGLAVVTFISLLINTIIGLRWYANRKKDIPLLQTQYRASLIEHEDDPSAIVSL